MRRSLPDACHGPLQHLKVIMALLADRQMMPGEIKLPAQRSAGTLERIRKLSHVPGACRAVKLRVAGEGDSFQQGAQVEMAVELHGAKVVRICSAVIPEARRCFFRARRASWMSL